MDAVEISQKTYLTVDRYHNKTCKACKDHKSRVLTDSEMNAMYIKKDSAYICKICDKTVIADFDKHYKINHMAEIVPSLYLGCFGMASNYKELKHFGITDIINTAYKLENMFPREFRYYNMELQDDLKQHISPYLDTITNYIHMLITNKAKVFVHCFLGISRSSSIIIAYLIKYHNMDYDTAFAYVSEKRCIQPNASFEKQLREFSDRIRKQ